MKFMGWVKCLAVGVLSVVEMAAPASAQSSSDIAQANNPLANFRSVSFQNYYMGELTGTNKTANQFWLRYAQPVNDGKWILRFSLPVNSLPTGPGGSRNNGIGDFNAFAAYMIDVGNPAVSFGIGPMLNAPTATDPGLGSGKWSGGFANVLFNATSPTFQYGYLLTWQGSFAGSSSRADVSFGAFQPFLMYQLGRGTYLRSVGIWTYDFKSDNYAIPVGLGIGQVKKVGKKVYNFYIEPQYTVASRGNGLPKWQILAGFNIQFMK